MKRIVCLAIASANLIACSFYARGPDQYRVAVREVLDTKQPDVESCYKRAYAADNAVQGRVVAKFQVEAKSGKVLKPEVVADKTTAPEPLKQCVLSSLEGLTIAPPDQRTGEAEFVWDFSR